MTNAEWIQLAGIGLTFLAMAGAGVAGYAKLAEKVRDHDRQLSQLEAKFDQHLKEANDTAVKVLEAVARVEERIVSLERRLTREENRH